MWQSHLGLPQTAQSPLNQGFELLAQCYLPQTVYSGP